jgi:hypothetical protein
LHPSFLFELYFQQLTVKPISTDDSGDLRTWTTTEGGERRSNAAERRAGGVAYAQPRKRERAEEARVQATDAAPATLATTAATAI